MKKIIKRVVVLLVTLTLEYGLIMGVTWMVFSIVNWTRLFNGYYPINNEIATIILFITVIMVIIKQLINTFVKKLEKKAKH